MSSRVRNVVLVVLLFLLVIVALLFTRCSRQATPPPASSETAPPVAKAIEPPAAAITRTRPEENLGAASLDVPKEALAGATVSVKWTGPDNPDDYVAIARPASAATSYERYRDTRHGPALDLLLPVEPGEWEVRYVTGKSKTILARAPIRVNAAAATLSAPDEVILGAPVAVSWTGPNHDGDFICIVRRGAPDDHTGSYAAITANPPVTIPAPVEAGDAEIRYVTGQHRKVLARRNLRVLEPAITIAAQADVVAGARFSVVWTGPANKGDYLTVVPKATPDGQYRHYTDVSSGSPLQLTAPLEAGESEIRYMTGRGARVLARRPIAVVAAAVSLSAPEKVVAGTVLSVEWSGPNNANDYITIVPKSAADGQYGNYTPTAKGSPLNVTVPIHSGPAEIRYMTGQGARVLARRDLLVDAAKISVQVPAVASADEVVIIDWNGPNNPGDYLTIVPKDAKDGVSARVAYTARGTPAQVRAPKITGACEVRYMSGQKNIVLARAPIEVR